ncbi:MAG: VCBS repeat-containing protein, partial [Planctomycetes bacterium]|nr:VCBS repeat-containing protein [Planctomycetota bacterium]
PGKLNVFVGEATNWRTGLALHGALRYRSLWPGVDLVVHGREGELQYDLHFQPSADLTQVALRVEGADTVRIDAEGAMVLATELGELCQQPPLTWEVAADGSRVVVPSAFELREDGSYGFCVERSDTSRPLVVDPVLVWGTYFGGSGNDNVQGVAVDDSAAVYVTGLTNGLPHITSGAYSSSINGSEAYIAKLDPSQSGAAQLIWCTYLGGAGNDSGTSIAVRASGTVVVAGVAVNSGSFPITANAYRATNGNFFLSEISADGTALIYSSYIDLWPRLIQLGENGTVYIGDYGSSPYASYPTTPGALQTSSAGDDLYFAKLDLSLVGSAQLVWASFLGGADAYALVDFEVSSTEPGVFSFVGHGPGVGYPVTHASGSISGWDCFLGRIDTNQVGAAQLRFFHAFGVDTSDVAIGLVVAPDQTTYVASQMFGNTNNHPRLTRFSGDGSTVLQSWNWAPGFGGSMGEGDLHLSADGTVTLVCKTLSGILPVTPDAVQSTPMGGWDLCIAQLDVVGQQVLFCSYLGGANAEIYRTGSSHLSDNLLTLGFETGGGLATPSAFQPSRIGLFEGYIARLELPFGAPPATGVGPRDVELLDLDGDGDLDAATANEISSNVSLRTNDGQGALSSEETFELTAGDSGPIALARCDLDNDGARDDLAVACEGSDTVVLVTDPSSTSRALSSLAIGGARASSVACGDLDANPSDDVVVGREGLPFVGGSGIGVSLNGAAFTSVLIPAPHPTQVVKVALGDLDGDGDLDLAAVARGGSDELLLFAGDGSGALAFAGALALSSSGLASGLALSDLDRDGRSDLCVVQPVLFPPSQTLRVYRRTSSGALSSSLFAAAVDVATSGALAIDLATGDLEQDSISGFLSRVDLAQANAGDGSVTLRHGFTGASFVSSTSPSAGTNPVAVAIGDLNGDGCDDLVVANQGSSDLSVVLTTAPALAQSYGAGCGGPLLAGVGSPTLGNPAFGVQVSNARAIAPAIFFYGLAPASVPLPPSACSVLFGGSLGSLLAFTGSSGAATLSFSVPNDPFLRGADLYFQCAVFRSPGGAFSGTLDLSNGLRLQVGA